MAYIIGLLTALLVLDCIILILLVIVQLPKKEAGAGMAFGGGTADALFGAGSGTVLTKITKYAIGILFVLALLIAMAQKPRSNFARQVENPLAVPLRKGSPVAPEAPAMVPAVANTNSLLLSVPVTNSAISPTAQ
jgi:preprotein translocase subunit SecG